MADLVTRLLLNSKQFDESIRKSTQQVLQFQQKTANIKSGVASVTSGFVKFAGGLGLAVTGVDLLTRSITSVVSINKEFEKSMDNFLAILNVSTEAMANYNREAIRLASNSTQSITSVAKLFTDLASRLPLLMETKEGISQVAESVITLAEATGLDTAVVGAQFANILNQYSASAVEAEKYANILAAATRAGAGEMDYLQASMEKFGGVASVMGVGLEESAAAVEVLAAKITEGETAGINMRNILLDLEATNDKALMPSVVGLTGALEELNRRHLTTTELVDLVDKRNVVALQTLMQGLPTLKEIQENITGTNTATEMAAINSDNLAGASNRLNTAWENLVTTMGGDDWLKNIVDGTAKALNNLTNLYLKVFEIEEYVARKSSEVGNDRGKSTISLIDEQADLLRKLENPTTGQKYTEIEVWEEIRYRINLKDGSFGIPIVIDEGWEITVANIADNYVKENFQKAKEAGVKLEEELSAERKKDAEEEAKVRQEYYRKYPIGSLAEINKQISDTKAKLELAVDSESRIALFKELDYLEEKKRRIEFEYKFPNAKAPEKIESTTSNVIELVKLDLPTEIPKIEPVFEKKDVNITNDYVDSLNAVANAMTAINTANIEGAAGWISWAGSLMTATGTAIEAIRQIVTAKTAEAAASGAAEAAKTPFVGWLMVGGAIASILAAFASLPSFSTGGIFAGNSTIGDMNLARVNAGEMILNNRQQRNLFNLLDGNGATTASGGEVTFKIQGKELVGVLNNYNRKVNKVL